MVMGAAALGAATEGEAETSETIGRAVSLLYVLGVGIFDCVLFFVGENVRDCERWVGFYMGGQSSRHPMEARVARAFFEVYLSSPRNKTGCQWGVWY